MFLKYGMDVERIRDQTICEVNSDQSEAYTNVPARGVHKETDYMWNLQRVSGGGHGEPASDPADKMV